jgi:hypothetical protein
MSNAAPPSSPPLARSLVPIAVLTLVWGCNWPILKLGVTELAPLTFRAITLPFAAIGLLLVARFCGDAIRVPRAWWGRVATLAIFNIAAWNGFILFGVQQMPAGRSASRLRCRCGPRDRRADALSRCQRKLAGLAGRHRHGAADRRRRVDAVSRSASR